MMVCERRRPRDDASRTGWSGSRPLNATKREKRRRRTTTRRRICRFGNDVGAPFAQVRRSRGGRPRFDLKQRYPIARFADIGVGAARGRVARGDDVDHQKRLTLDGRTGEDGAVGSGYDRAPGIGSRRNPSPSAPPATDRRTHGPASAASLPSPPSTHPASRPVAQAPSSPSTLGEQQSRSGDFVNGLS